MVLGSDVDPSAFREAMKAFHLGGTYKITGTKRHPLGDDLLVSHVDTTGAKVVDVGASDGSTSLDLFARMPRCASFTMADLYLKVTAVRMKRWVAFFAPDDTCILVSNGHLLAWPGMSRPVRAIMAPVVRAARRRDRAEVLLINPHVRRTMAADPRFTARVHDVFTPWPDGTVDVVKVANLLRRLYFADEKLLEGLRAIHESLAEGGHLLLVDNPRIAGIDERAGLYRKESGSFVTVAETGHRPEIADLVARVAVRESAQVSDAAS
jgi:hypothetical protein